MAGEHGETLPALDDLVRQSKVRALGEAATFATADDLNTSQAIAAANGLMSFVTMEANCSIVVRDAAVGDHTMKIALWVLQILFAALFMLHAVLHLFPPPRLKEILAEQNIPVKRTIATWAEVVASLGLRARSASPHGSRRWLRLVSLW
jgi:hypothetical protein